MEKAVSGSLINLAVHPHDGADTYVALFRALYGLDLAVRVHGDRYAWMSHLWENTDSKGRVFLTGNIATFTQIDINGAWIDMSTRRPADEDRLRPVKRAVQGVQPNYHEFRFYFDPSSHQAVVEESDGKRSFSPQMAERFFRAIASRSPIEDEFGEVEVHFVPDRESINRIIGSKYLRKIRIHLTRPNTDSLAQIEAQLLKQLDEMGAKAADIEYTAVRGGALELDDRTKDVARVARKNGYVEGNVAGEKLSTKDHPFVKSQTYDDQAQSQESAFNTLAQDMISTEVGNSSD